MYQTRLDQLAERANSTAIALKNLRHFAESNAEELPAVFVEDVAREVSDMIQRLGDLAQRLEEGALSHRSALAADRAWRLIRLAEAGAIDRDGCYELANLRNSSAHRRLGFEPALCDALSSPWLIELILDRTAYTECIAGVFA